MEVKDGQIDVQPYDYRDGDILKKLIGGAKKAEKAAAKAEKKNAKTTKKTK